MDTSILNKQIEILLESSSDLSEVESQNIILDVIALNERINTGNYKYTDFINRNKYDITKRTKEFFLYFKSYNKMAVSLERILGTFDLKAISPIVDLCPGWAPKVEMALNFLDYRGEVVVIDREKDSLLTLSDFFSLFRSKLKLITKNEDVYEIKDKYSFIIGNHIIDDLILFEFSRNCDLDLNEIYKSEIVFLEAIDKILKDFDRNSFVAKLSELLIRITANKGIILLTQYSSLIDNNLIITNWTKYCKSILYEVCEVLVEQGFENITNSHLQQFNKFEDNYFQKEDVIVLQNESNY